MESMEPEIFRNAHLHTSEFIDDDKSRLIIDPETDVFTEDFRERLITKPVFEKAMDLQRVMGNTRIKKDQIETAWSSAHRNLLELNAHVKEQGALLAPVTLKGEGILVPMLGADLARDIATMSLLSDEDRRDKLFKRYLVPDETKGLFNGFTVHFVETDGWEVYKPVLAYQVTLKEVSTPYSQTQLYATGDVGQTQIEFDQDDRLDEASDCIGLLYQLCPKQGATINRIVSTLSSTENYDASMMRHVGFHADKLIDTVKKGKQQFLQDALADLLRHYVDKHSVYLVKALSMNISDPAGSGELYYNKATKKLYSLMEKYIDFVFMPRTEVTDKSNEYDERMKLHIVMEFSSASAYVPLTDIDVFEKQ
jgi:hypothetical protein